jgi:hypothetical protein
MSFLIGFLITAALTGSLLWAVARCSGFALPVPDLVLIVALCNGLALLPRAGWLLAMAILSLLLLRTTEADAWPDAVLIVTGSGVVWLVVNVFVIGLWSW